MKDVGDLGPVAQGEVRQDVHGTGRSFLRMFKVNRTDAAST